MGDSQHEMISNRKKEFPLVWTYSRTLVSFWLFVFVVQLLSHVQLFPSPWSIAFQTSLSFTIARSLLKLKSIQSMMPSNHLILCHPFSSCPQSFQESESFPMSQLFRMRWPKYWSFSFSTSPSSEYSGLISLRID